MGPTLCRLGSRKGASYLSPIRFNEANGVVMIRLLTAVLLFTSFNVAADDLKIFSDGQVIEADDFNHNFQKLEQDIADIPAGSTGPAGQDGVLNGVTC